MIDRYAKLFGISVNCGSQNEIVELFELGIGSKKSRSVVFFEGNLFAHIKNRKVQNALRNAFLVLPDGVIIAKSCSIRLSRTINTLTGPDMMLKIIEYGRHKGWKHFFLGSTIKTLKGMMEKINKIYGEINMNYFSPSFDITESEIQEIIKKIASYRPNFLWVALGSPKQELFVEKYKYLLLSDWVLSVGAAFDFHSDIVKRAPIVIREMKLEWMYRMFAGGKRILKRNAISIPRAIVNYLMVLVGIDKD